MAKFCRGKNPPVAVNGLVREDLVSFFSIRLRGVETITRDANEFLRVESGTRGYQYSSSREDMLVPQGSFHCKAVGDTIHVQPTNGVVDPGLDYTCLLCMSKVLPEGPVLCDSEGVTRERKSVMGPGMIQYDVAVVLRADQRIIVSSNGMEETSCWSGRSLIVHGG